MQKKIKPLLAISILIASVLIDSQQMAVAAANKHKNTCAFIDKNAFENRATCYFSGDDHRTVMIVPSAKTSAKQAAEWIVNASFALQIGGERDFYKIISATRPDFSGDTVETSEIQARSAWSDAQKIRASTVVCKHANDWSEVIGPEGSPPAAKPQCKPYKQK